MQYIIEIGPDQDLQFLLTLLEKMQVVYRPIESAKKAKTTKNGQPVFKNIADEYAGKLADNSTLKPSERLAGKLSSETAKALLAHIEASRNEWERTF